ncbi:hypothetical protein JCM9279_007204 [Rhodotorula babjevae]
MYTPLAAAAVSLLALASSFDTASAATSTTLADGNWFQSGSISNTFRWQASGQLSANRCPRAVVALRWSGTCYTSSLGATGNLQSTTQQQYLAAVASSSSAAAARKVVALAASPSSNSGDARSEAELRALQDDEDLDAYFEAFPEQEPYRFPGYAAYEAGGPSFKAKRQVNGCGPPPPSTTVAPPSSTTTTSAPSTTTTAEVTPRQRNELFTWPGAVAGQTWRYTWKTYQAATSTNFNFFHAWQILRRDGCGGAVITLDYLNGQVVITDTVRDCKPCASFNQGIGAWFNKEVRHDLTITYGLNGSINYKAYVQGQPRVPAVYYRATGDMGSSASLKIGNYRRATAGQQASTAYIGEFVQTRLS